VGAGGYVSTGLLECAYADSNCVDAGWQSGSNVSPQACSNALGGSGYMGYARCKARPATDNWDKVVTWNSVGAGGLVSTGLIECAKADSNCVDAGWQSGSNVSPQSCSNALGGTGYMGYARCKARAATDNWDKVVTWNSVGAGGLVSTGSIECARANSTCTNAGWVSGSNVSPQGCDTPLGSTGYMGYALCKTSSLADTNVTWYSNTSSGNVECTKANAICQNEWWSNTSIGGTLNCGSSGGANTTTIALCKTATLAADGWNKGVSWTSLSTTGAAQCSAIGATCVGAFDASDGTSKLCSATLTSGAAQCAK
jgi:hypothetical protein